MFEFTGNIGDLLKLAVIIFGAYILLRGLGVFGGKNGKNGGNNNNNNNNRSNNNSNSSNNNNNNN